MARVRSRRYRGSGKVSTFADRVLAKLASGGKGCARPDGGYIVGSLVIPCSLVEDLSRRELVQITASGDLQISLPGQAYVRRAGAACRRVQSDSQQTQNPYAKQHQIVYRKNFMVDGKMERRDINAGDAPLGWLRARKGKGGLPLITQRQYEAGERLRSDFEVAVRARRVIQSYDGVPTNGGNGSDRFEQDRTATEIAAKSRFEDAVCAVGRDLSDVVVRVCCQLEGLEQAEKGLGWPCRSAKIVLLIGLNRLADHYYPPMASEKTNITNMVKTD